MKPHISTLALIAVLALATGCRTESYVRRGDAAFAAGRPEEALQYYERVYRSSSKYRADPGFGSKMKQTRVQVLLLHGRRALNSKQWDAAMAKLEEALQLDPSLGSARQLLAEAKQGAADAALARACKAADQGHLAEAQQQCALGLGHQPQHSGLLQAQGSLSPQAPGQDVLAEVARLVADHRWTQADSMLGGLLESHPYHLAARNRRALVLGKLGEERRLFGTAKVQTRNGDLLAAEKSLVQLQKVSPHHPEVQGLLAGVRSRLAEGRALLAKAKQAEQRGRPGMALRHLAAARNAWSCGVAGSEVARLQGVLRETYPVRMSWEATGPGAELVRGTLLRKLGRGTRDKDGPVYEMKVHVQPGAGRVDTVRTEQLQHMYVTREVQPNPEIPGLRHDKRRYELEERRMRGRYEEAVRDLRHAQRHVPKDTPHRPPKDTPHRPPKDTVRRPPRDVPDREQVLRRLTARVERSRRELNEAERRLRRASHRLRMASATVVVERRLAWPYIRRTMRKTLTVSAVATMGSAGEKVVAPTSFSRSATADDTVNDGANPGLGLRVDRLSLPSDQALAASAGNALAQDVGTWARGVSRQAWVGQLVASSEELRRQGEEEDAVELAMAAEAYRVLMGK